MVGKNKVERRPRGAEIEILRPMTLSAKRKKIKVMKRLEQCKDNNMSKTYRLLCV
jgi:hypothetical protein